MAEVIACNTTLASDKNPFGTVTGGKIVIRGRVEKLWLDLINNKLLDNQRFSIPDTDFISDGTFGEWHLIPECTDRVKTFCLLLAEQLWHMPHDQYDYDIFNLGDNNDISCIFTVIALVKSKRQEGCYERIGLHVGAAYDMVVMTSEHCDSPQGGNVV